MSVLQQHLFVATFSDTTTELLYVPSIANYIYMEFFGHRKGKLDSGSCGGTAPCCWKESRCHIKGPSYYTNAALASFPFNHLTPAQKVSSSDPFNRTSQLSCDPGAAAVLKAGTRFKPANKLAANCLSDTCWRRHRRSPPAAEHPAEEEEDERRLDANRNRSLKDPPPPSAGRGICHSHDKSSLPGM